MVVPCLNFNVDVNKCFGGLWKFRRRSKAGIKIGPWGDSGELNFGIGGGGSAFQITSVKLYTGTVVDSLEVFYVVDRKNVETRRFGGEGGVCHPAFELRPGEYIISMLGSVNDLNGETCIAKLGFTTNLKRTYGPFGAGGGREFSVPIIDGRIVGFFGKHDRYLKTIGVYLAPN